MTATEVRSFQATIPAGTPVTAPVTIDTSFPAMTVDQVNIKVPPGPSGLMGFRLTMNGEQVIPINLGQWIITDDETLQLPMANLPNSGEWQVQGYNTGIYDLSVYVDFLLSPTGAASAPADQQASDLTTAIVLASAAS